MFGLSLSELFVIGVVALLVLGPEQLPGAARSLGRALRDLNLALAEARAALEREAEDPRPGTLPAGETGDRDPGADQG